MCIVALEVAWPHTVLRHFKVELEILDPSQLLGSLVTLKRGEDFGPLPKLEVVLRGEDLSVIIGG